MKQREQKTFNCENEIIAAIEEKQAQSEKLLAESVAIEQEARHLIRNGNGAEDKEAGEFKLKQAAQADRKAQRITGELQNLKDALAAFRTEVLPIIVPKDGKQYRVTI